MRLVELYVYEAVRHLPKKKRERVASEIRAEIEEALSENPSEEEVKRVLNEWGDPSLVVTRYSGEEPRYVIGPLLFPVYVKVLSIVLPIVLTVMFFTMLMAALPTLTGDVVPTIGDFLADLIGVLWNVGIQLVFWITLVFAIVERYAPKGGEVREDKWSVEQLRDLAARNRISKWDAGFGLFWTAVWFGLYLNAERIIGIYESTGDGFKQMMPIFNQTFLMDMIWFFLIVVVVQVILGVVKWMRGHWTYGLATLNAVYNVLVVTFVLWMGNSSELLDTRFVEWFEANVSNGANILQWMLWVVMVITTVAATWDSIDGFRRARKLPGMEE